MLNNVMYYLSLLCGAALVVTALWGFNEIRKEFGSSLGSSSAIFISVACLLAGVGVLSLSNYTEEIILPIGRVTRLASTYQVTTEAGTTYDISRVKLTPADTYTLKVYTTKGLFGQVFDEEAELVIPSQPEVLFEN